MARTLFDRSMSCQYPFRLIRMRVMAQSTAAARVTRPSADATRKRILAAALDLFSEISFDGATTREIAARADVTQPLLNYHFSSKDELWRAAVDGLFAELNEALSSRAQGLRGVDELTVAKLVVREFIYFSAAHPQLHRIITQECKSDGPRMDWLVERHIRPRYEQTVALFARLVDAGHLPDIAAPHLYYILTGAGPTMFVLAPECRRLAGIDPLAPDVVEAHADAVIALIFGR
jgi:TetR/AcrR family transcriptional regulator